MIGILKRVKPSFWVVALIFLLGLLPLTYFLDGKLIFGGDHGLWILNPWGQIYNNFFLWNTRAIEAYGPYFPLLNPSLIFLAVVQSIHIPPFISEGLLLSLLFLSSGLAAFFLSRVLFGTQRVIIHLSVALFYMFNAYSLIQWSIPHFVTFAALAYYPFVLSLFVRGLSSPKIFKNSVIFAIGSLVFVTGNFMPSYLLITFFSLFVYFIFHMLFLTQTREQKKHSLKFALVAGLLFLLTNFWWIIPLGSLRQEGLGWFASSDIGMEWSVSNYSKRTSFLNLFQLQGWPGWGTDTFGYDKIYTENLLLLILSVLPLIVAVFGLIRLSRNKSMSFLAKRKIIFFLLFFLLALFLNKGSHQPFAEINLWLYRHLPGFVIFRTVFVKFGIMLSLSLAILFGVGIGILKDELNRKRFNISSIVIGLILILNLIYVFPFFTGKNILTKDAFNGSTPHHKIPNSYFEAVNWWNKKSEQFKILSLPGQGNWSVFNWGNDDLYIGMDVFSELSKKTFLLAHTSGNLLKNSAFEMFEKGDLKNIEQLLGLLNVRYILLHNDSNFSIFGSLPPSEIRKELENFGIKKDTEFDKLALYKISENNFYPHIYIPEKEIFLTGPEEKVENFLASNDLNQKTALFLDDSIIRPEEKQKALQRSQSISLTVKPVNPGLQRRAYLSEVIIPFAKFTPGNKIYGLIEKKEQEQERAVSQDTEQLLKTKLLFANKRLLEIVKMAKDKDVNYVDSTVTRYQEKMNEVVALLEKDEAQKRYIVDLLVIIESYLKRQNELLKSILTESALTDGNKSKILRTLADNQKLARYLRDKESQTFWLNDPTDRNITLIAHHFIVPRDGEYRIFLSKQQTDDNFYDFEILPDLLLRKIGDDAKTISARSTRIESGWISFGPVNLTEGEYVSSIKKFPTKNLILNKTWESLQHGVLLEIGGDSLRFESTMKPSTVITKIDNFSPGEFYRIKFDYYTESGVAPVMAVWQGSQKNPSRQDLLKAFSDELIIKENNWEDYKKITENRGGKLDSFNLESNAGQGWQHFEDIIETSVKNKSLILAFQGGQPDEVSFIPSINQIKNIRLEKFFSNTLVLNSSPFSITKIPKMEFTRINATKYKVKIVDAKEPFDLVFSESFHSGWNAYLKDLNERDFSGEEIGSYFNGQIKEKSYSNEFLGASTFEALRLKPLAQNTHLLVNGYANAWTINRAGDFEIILEFVPQRLFYLGIFVFIGTIFGIVIVVLKKYARSNR